VRRAACALALLIIVAGADCDDTAVPTTVYFPLGNCPAGAMIEVEQLLWSETCLPVEVQCYVHPAYGLVPRGACVVFPNQWDVANLRVRCVGDGPASDWVYGLDPGYADPALCTALLN